MNLKKDTIPVILVVTEGETERKYLDNLRIMGAGYALKVQRSSNRSAMGVVQHCKKRIKGDGIDIKGKDGAYCVFDIDENTEEQLKEAIELAEKSNIKVILSNPCFEVFFLYHFEKKLPLMKKPCDVKDHLSKFINGYKENCDYWSILLDNQNKALERIRGTHIEEIPLSLDECVAMTNIWELFDDLEKNQKEELMAALSIQQWYFSDIHSLCRSRPRQGSKGICI